MPIYQCSAAAGLLTSAMKAEIAAAITDAHVEATGAPCVFVHVLTDANCARVGKHHRKPLTKDRKGSGTLQEVMGVPAWKSRPSWFLVAAGDQAIPPEAERQFAARMGATTIEVPSNHVAMVSHPQDVLALIQAAAQAVQA